jgi:hypothetical protein
MLNDIFGFQQALLMAGAIIPNETSEKVSDSQYLQAIIALASGVASYYEDTGAADAYVFDVIGDSQGPADYYDGLVVRGQIENTNTGASTLNVAGLGVKDIKKRSPASGGSVAALVAGDLPVNAVPTFIFNETEDAFILQFAPASQTFAGPIATSTQAQQEAGSSTAVATSPGTQQYHPSALKMWCQRDGAASPGILSSYNVTSLTDSGVGLTTINLTVNFSSVNWSRCATRDIGSSGNLTIGFGGAASASSILVSTAADVDAHTVSDQEWAVLSAGDQ